MTIQEKLAHRSAQVQTVHDVAYYNMYDSELDIQAMQEIVKWKGSGAGLY